MNRDQIALELYTVRRPAAEDLPGTLRAVAAAGYRAVELAALPDIATPDLAHLLDDVGLRAIASHEPLETLRRDPGAVADRLAALGCRHVVLPSLSPDERRTADDVRRVAAELGAIGQTLADRGLRLGYHNHAFEFEPLDGTTTWDVLLAELRPDVDLELDVYWLSIGGRDPVAEIRAAAGRVRLLHMKDAGPGPDRRDLPPGAGVLPFPAIVEAGRAAGVEWYVVEQDEPDDPLESAATGLRYLESLAG